MFCPYCGKETPDYSNACQNCGAVLPTQAPQQAPQQTPYVAPQQAPYAAQQPFPSFAPPAPPTPTKKKNKTPMIIAIVVVVFILAGIGFTAEKIFQAEDNSPAGSYDIVETPELADTEGEFHTLEKQTEDGLIRFTYYCDGDEVLGWSQEVELDVSLYTQEQIDQLVAACYSEYQNMYASLDCVDHSVDVFGDTLVETYIITDVNDNIEELKSAGFIDGGLVTLYLSYEQSEASLLAQGYVEVEE